MPDDKQSTWWRWPLIFPACIAGSIVGSALMGLFQWFGMKMTGGYSEDGWYFLYILPLITSATFGYLWVTITCYVAPKGKKTSAIVTTTILGVLLLLTILFSLTNPDYQTGEKVQSVIGGIAMIIAAIYTLIAFEENTA